MLESDKSGACSQARMEYFEARLKVAALEKNESFTCIYAKMHENYSYYHKTICIPTNQLTDLEKTSIRL